MRESLVHGVRAAGALLRERFGRIRDGRVKENPSSIVTEADLASEALIVEHLRGRFPTHGIIAEESGCRPGSSEYTWVIDPLDGTSNFVAGLPWFGAQMGLLEGATPVLAAMYLPVPDLLYVAERGNGVRVGDRKLALPGESDPHRVLCAFGFDGSAGDPEAVRRHAGLLAKVAGGVRNIRATNSLVDFCYTLEGHFGACVNLHPRIWDIVPASLMFPEAGGCFTDLDGRALEFDLGPGAGERVYPIVGAGAALHPRILALIRG